MAKETLISIVQRLLGDPDFRERYFADPDEALAEYNLDRRDRNWFERNAIVDEESLSTAAKTLGLDGRVVREASMPPIEPTPPPVARNGDDGSAPERIVSTGFAAEGRGARPLDANRPLSPDRLYYFWFEVGAPVEGSIELVAAELPIEKLPPEARLHVVLFSFPGQLQITPGADVGEIKIMPDGSVRVVKSVVTPDDLTGDPLLEKRIFFPVRTPANEGKHQMRCNIYYKQTLVQSRLVTAQVGRSVTATDEPMLTSEMDYTLSKVLNGEQLQGMGENLLSMMLNDNGDGTHGFRFFGQDEFKNDAALGEGELINLIDVARGAMRRAAWGDKEPYTEGKSYRYGGGLDEAMLLDDLIFMAIRGKRFYDALINQIAGDADRAWDLEDLMVKPGQVQLASKESARLVVPLAMFYDYRLDDGAPNSAYSLCPSFKDSLHGNKPLEDTACFQGNCPTRNEDLVVCPSGFWGFRHYIGLPVSVKAAPDATTEIPSPGTPKLATSVSTDPAFKRRQKHEEALKAMGYGWEYADDRDESLEMLKNTESQVVYFYCHGGLTSENFPYLSVGSLTGKRFTRNLLRDWRIRWRTVRPLVFINGCHTTSLTPEAAIDLVGGFVETSHAAGVIGTEITNFEALAVAFAEECLHRFLTDRQTLGEAVRGARLKVLKDGNPLGLIYIPFALPGLKVV